MNSTLLKKKIEESGIKLSAIADKTGISRVTLYKKINKVTEFTASEIVMLTKILNLSRDERDEIFLPNKLN